RARVGGPPAADLVPGRRVRVQRRAGIPRPQAPDVRRVQPVPVLGSPVLHGLDQFQLLLFGRGRERGPAARVRVGIQVGQGVPPGLTVFGYVGIPPAVGLARGQSGVDHSQDGDLKVIVLA